MKELNICMYKPNFYLSNCIENKISVTELLNIFSRDDRESVVRSDPHHGIQLFPFTCAGIELQNMVKEAIDIVISS